MSYKVYVTYICCVILNNIQIHFKPSRTYTYIQQSIVLGHLLLRIHYLMALPGLDPVEGSQRFTSFLVRLLVFKSRAVTYTPVGCVSLLRNVCMCQCACMCQCVCMCLQSGQYRESIPILFLFQTLSKNLIPFPRRTVLNLTQGSSVTSGELIRNLVSAHSKYLCVHLLLILHFEVGVSVTADFPVNWSQCQRP